MQENSLVKLTSNKWYSVLFLFVLILVLVFRFRLFYNEMDVIPYAMSVYDQDWMSFDWYLNLKIQYRYLFSYVVGFLVETLGIFETIVFGRLITFFLLAIACTFLFRAYQIRYNQLLFIVGLVIFFKYFEYGMGSGEWIIGGLETKAFAYAFVILSLALVVRGRITHGFLFAGLALSFHMLVGAYHLACLVPLCLFQLRRQDLFTNLKIAIPAFLVGGSLGLYALVSHVFLEAASTITGWEYYVNISVPHHVVPSIFPSKIWILAALFSLINILFVLKCEKKEIKSVAYYALCSVLFFAIGLIIYYWTGPLYYLKFYFFRFGDIMLPLLTLLNVAAFVNYRLENSNFKESAFPIYVSTAILIALIIPRLIYMAPRVVFDKEKIIAKTHKDIKMQHWVKENTDRSKTFITRPDDIFFYLNYDRPMFVSIRHSPQRSEDLVVWYNRLKTLNSGREFSSKDQVVTNYPNLTTHDVHAAMEEYPEIGYILMPKGSELNFPILYESEKQKLYELVKP